MVLYDRLSFFFELDILSFWLCAFTLTYSSSLFWRLLKVYLYAYAWRKTPTLDTSWFTDPHIRKPREINQLLESGWYTFTSLDTSGACPENTSNYFVHPSCLIFASHKLLCTFDELRENFGRCAQCCKSTLGKYKLCLLTTDEEHL